MARFYPPVDFSKPPVIKKAGDYAERKVLEALKELDHTSMFLIAYLMSF